MYEETHSPFLSQGNDFLDQSCSGFAHHEHRVFHDYDHPDLVTEHVCLFNSCSNWQTLNIRLRQNRDLNRRCDSVCRFLPREATHYAVNIEAPRSFIISCEALLVDRLVWPGYKDRHPWDVTPDSIEMATSQAPWTIETYAQPDHELVELAWALGQVNTDSPASVAERAIQPVTTSTRVRAARGLINFKKTWLYANSRLPPFMPPMVVYMPTWRLLCLAAQASLSVYNRPRGEEREHFINANWQNSTKAMVLQSRPIDDQNVIVFAIRGSQLNFVDWSINFRPEPTSTAGFLDDAGNACHAGFLTVAKAMISPVAARLRQLLEQNPSRTASSLLITGHSAGGAIAALLYAHMLSHSVESELHTLTGCFKRVHCITFGAPPLTLLPLSRPSNCKKSIFMAIVNEGDPIARAEKAYVLSLARVLAAPAPQLAKPQRSFKKFSTQFLKGAKPSQVAPYWPLPAATLSNAGRIIVIREKPGSDTKLQAVSTTDEQLRDVLFGDPAMHAMALYKERTDQLAISAVTGSNVT